VSPADRLIVALDVASRADCDAALERVGAAVRWVKVGSVLFAAEGPSLVTELARRGYRVFLDLKLHDIPETVGRAVRAAAAFRARYLTVHAAGGKAMLARAVMEAEAAATPLSLLAVTVLTSLDAEDLEAQGVAASPQAHVVRLAQLAWDAGVRGFVASPAEAGPLRRALGREALIVTPGIRPANTDAFDQKRIATPAQAIADGADLLVVGRPIRDAEDPLAAARAVVEEIRQSSLG
jgi:orotidine-5'-phosphate decarboxylase